MTLLSVNDLTRKSTSFGSMAILETLSREADEKHLSAGEPSRNAEHGIPAQEECQYFGEWRPIIDNSSAHLAGYRASVAQSSVYEQAKLYISGTNTEPGAVAAGWVVDN